VDDPWGKKQGLAFGAAVRHYRDNAAPCGPEAGPALLEPGGRPGTPFSGRTRPGFKPRGAWRRPVCETDCGDVLKPHSAANFGLHAADPGEGREYASREVQY
jgi:hypothetical protein